MNLHYLWIYLAVFIGTCAGNYMSYLFISNAQQRKEKHIAKIMEELVKFKNMIEEEKDDK